MLWFRHKKSRSLGLYCHRFSGPNPYRRNAEALRCRYHSACRPRPPHDQRCVGFDWKSRPPSTCCLSEWSRRLPPITGPNRYRRRLCSVSLGMALAAWYCRHESGKNCWDGSWRRPPTWRLLGVCQDFRANQSAYYAARKRLLSPRCHGHFEYGAPRHVWRNCTRARWLRTRSPRCVVQRRQECLQFRCRIRQQRLQRSCLAHQSLPEPQWRTLPNPWLGPRCHHARPQPRQSLGALEFVFKQSPWLTRLYCQASERRRCASKCKNWIQARRCCNHTFAMCQRRNHYTYTRYELATPL